MAAPPNKTLADMNGKWVLNKTLSDNPDPALQLQGIGWMLRKAIGAASVTLDAKQYTGPPEPPNESKEPVARIDIEQTASGGIKGTSEHRCVDGVFRPHSDWLFGTNQAKSEWLSAADLAGRVAAEYGEHMTKGWLEGEAEAAGPAGETHIINRVENLDKSGGWKATQVWGFAIVEGARRHTRLLQVEKDGKKIELRLVYDYVP